MADFQKQITNFLDISSSRMSLENGHEKVLKLCDLALRGELAEAADLIVSITSTGKEIPYDGIEFRTLCADVMFSLAEKIHPKDSPLDRQTYFLEAIEHLTKVIEQDPNNGKAYERRAVAFQENNKYMEAIDDYKQAVIQVTDVKEALLPLWALKTLPTLIPDREEANSVAKAIGGYEFLVKVVNFATTCRDSAPVIGLISEYTQQLSEKTEFPDRWKLQMCRVLACFVEQEVEYATQLAHLQASGVLDPAIPEHNPFSFTLTNYERQRLLECDGVGDAEPWRGAFHEHSRTHSPTPINKGASKVFAKGTH